MFSCANENQQEPTEATSDNQQKPNFIKPFKTENGENYFNISFIEIHLPIGFSVTEGIGPDFSVYYFKYPGGAYGGIAFSQYPDVAERISNLSRNDYRTQEWRDLPADPFNLKAPLDSLAKNGVYTEVFEDRHIDPFVRTEEFMVLYPNIESYTDLSFEERQKYEIRDSFRLEVRKIDSTYIWKYFDQELYTGSYGLLITDNEEYGWTTHFFSTLNRFTNKEVLDTFSNQLISSFKSTQ
jgi:hypothetical protein